VLTGVGGIGKTALAGRTVARLRDAGWLIAEHIGVWNPTALSANVADALDNTPSMSWAIRRIVGSLGTTGRPVSG
jgi:hypothetical protein